jgi:hypothetical protein
MFLLSSTAVFFQLLISDAKAAPTAKESFFPGGYLCLSTSFGKNKTTGLQGSVAIAVPSIGEPAMGPYLFPGIAVGKRRSLVNQKSYFYTDLQITYNYWGIWGGTGLGYLFSEDGNRLRTKFYGGYLLGGYSTEYLMGAGMESLFHGVYLGLAVPMIGNHFHP